MDESELERKAVEELLKETSRAKVRAETMGATGWMKCPLGSTNKRFLLNTLRSSAVTHQPTNQRASERGRDEPRSLHGGGRGEQAHADGVHQSAAARARERVSLQQVHLPPAPRGARAHPQPHRETHQDLVPEPTHEVEKGGGQEESQRSGSRTGFLDHVRRSEGGVVCRSGHGTPLTSALSPTSSPTRLVKQTLTKRDMCHQRNLSACHRRVEILV
uniref:Pancreas/duodenum homeobox protein 1-like n=2 Tax=Cyprinus carpio TaxID=7962 RepID=A0A8C1WAQ6_CYPCA